MAMGTWRDRHPRGTLFSDAVWHPPEPTVAGEKRAHHRSERRSTDDGEENFEQELQEIVESIRVEQQQAGEALFTRTHLFPIFLAVSVAMFNQLAGINAILYYLNDIFAHAGFSKVTGNLQAVAVGGTNLLFTSLAMSVIDRIGRKTLLLIGSIGTAVCLA